MSVHRSPSDWKKKCAEGKSPWRSHAIFGHSNSLRRSLDVATGMPDECVEKMTVAQLQVKHFLDKKRDDGKLAEGMSKIQQFNMPRMSQTAKCAEKQEIPVNPCF